MSFTATHGLARRGAVHPLYNRWQKLKQRCLNPKDRKFPCYGARGIFVCDRWLDFALFVEDMGVPPGGDYVVFSIDRIDNDGPYAKWNCRWATVGEQNANKRDRLNAAERRRQYREPWPFGVLTVDKHVSYGGMAGYVEHAFIAFDRGEYEFDHQEQVWLDEHLPGWREPVAAPV